MARHSGLFRHTLRVHPTACGDIVPGRAGEGAGGRASHAESRVRVDAAVAADGAPCTGTGAAERRPGPGRRRRTVEARRGGPGRPVGECARPGHAARTAARRRGGGGRRTAASNRPPSCGRSSTSWATSCAAHMGHDGIEDVRQEPPGDEARHRCRCDLDPPGQPPLVTVVVATRDRHQQLATCLRSILAVSYPSFEVIVVDNAPSDDVDPSHRGRAVRGRPRASITSARAVPGRRTPATSARRWVAGSSSPSPTTTPWSTSSGSPLSWPGSATTRGSPAWPG